MIMSWDSVSGFISFTRDHFVEIKQQIAQHRVCRMIGHDKGFVADMFADL